MQYYQGATMSTLSEFHRHLQASLTFLRNQNFAYANKSAIFAQISDPNHPVPRQIIAISSILNAPPTDLYTILGLPPFTTNLSSINTHFQHLKSLLNSSLPFASDAYALVLNAWSVLSDPVQKSRFDQRGGNSNTFWTVCPYCYFVYEYLKVYEDCCFKCPNENCRKAFQGVPLGNPPPVDMVEKGKYLFGGFSWSPFGKKENAVIEISDEADNSKINSGVGSEEKDFLGNIGGDVVGEESCNRKIVCGSRIKMASPRSSRKLAGKGVRVRMDEFLAMMSKPMNHGTEAGGSEFDIWKDEILPMKRTNVGIEAGSLDFSFLEDDIFVGMQDIGVGII